MKLALIHICPVAGRFLGFIVAWNQDGDEKIYVDVESKGSTSDFDQRSLNRKNKCGHAIVKSKE